MASSWNYSIGNPVWQASSTPAFQPSSDHVEIGSTSQDVYANFIVRCLCKSQGVSKVYLEPLSLLPHCIRLLCDHAYGLSYLQKKLYSHSSSIHLVRRQLRLWKFGFRDADMLCSAVQHNHSKISLDAQAALFSLRWHSDWIYSLTHSLIHHSGNPTIWIHR